MKVRLLRDAKIKHTAGEIVNVSPEEAFYLCSLGSAVEVIEKPTAATAEPKKPNTKGRVKK
jgi:hypothetical protein